MAKREIQIFSVAFLDLLAGALAAVIILFVVIPKMSHEQIDAVEALERLEIQVEDLESILEQAQNSIPTELYEQIQEQMEQLNNTITELNNEINTLNNELANCRESLRRAEQEIEELRSQISRTDSQNLNQNTGPGQKLFGVDAQFAIVITWAKNLDVDLHVINNANNQRVFFRNMRESWGILMADVTQRHGDEDMYELFYQNEIVPGTYDVYIHLYSNVNQSVHVSGYIAIFPFTAQEVTKDLPVRTIRHSDGLVKLGTVTLTSNSFTFN